MLWGSTCTNLDVNFWISVLVFLKVLMKRKNGVWAARLSVEYRVGNMFTHLVQKCKFSDT